MPRRTDAWLLIEAVVCFAAPVYVLFWGVLLAANSLPLALAGSANAQLDVLTALGGCIGLAALLLALLFLLTGVGSSAVTSKFVWLSGGIGVLSLWAAVTTYFREFPLDSGMVILALIPTLASAHVAWLVYRRFRYQ